MSGEARECAAAAAFAPGSIGNVGPGFDVLGLAIDGIGDTVTVGFAPAGPSRIGTIAGRDAEQVPRDPAANCAAIAAREYLRRRAIAGEVVVSVDKGLPLSGGLGGSAASSVAGAIAANLLAVALAAAATPRDDSADSGDLLPPPSVVNEDLLASALAGERIVAGAHLDNIGPSLFGGLTLARCVDPIDVVALSIAADWWLALWTPRLRIETRSARALLDATSERATWVQQMANTAALVHAFAHGDGALLGRALDDRYAEPRRAALIPRFFAVKTAARIAGAFGGSISGAGPTVFAIAPDEPTARAVAEAMQRAGEVESTTHVGAIARQGARRA
jgi:homoserine kinase